MAFSRTREAFRGCFWTERTTLGSNTSSSFMSAIISVSSATGASPLAVRAATSPCFCVLVRAAVWASLVWCRPPESPAPSPHRGKNPQRGHRNTRWPWEGRWAWMESAPGTAGPLRLRGSRCLAEGGWTGCGTWEGKGQQSAWRSWCNAGERPAHGPQTQAACYVRCCHSRGFPLERKDKKYICIKEVQCLDVNYSCIVNL